jgi:hypothetical protein
VKQKVLFVIALLVAVTVLPRRTRAQSPLLTGCTVNSSNVPSCSMPTGWSLTAAQGFDSGSVPSTQATLGTITTNNPHTGSRSLQEDITFDQASDTWFLSKGTGAGQLNTFTSVYLSYYEWLDSSAAINDELIVADISNSLSGVLQQEIVIDRFGNTFNTLTPNILVESQGNASGAIGHSYYGPSPNIGAGSWHQWEIEWTPNSTSCSGTTGNGSVQIYIDGTLKYNLTSACINGTVTMSGNSGLYAGGVNTKLIWTNNGALPPSGTCVAMGAGEGFSTSFSFSKIDTYCGPLAPSFNRYIDDVIVMTQGSGGGSGGSVSLSPTGLSFGTVTQGTTSGGQTTTLTNGSGSTITLTSFAFTGTNASNFSQTNTCGATLTNGNSCTVTVKFSPTAAPGTNETGTLAVNYTGFTGSPVTASLTGTSGGIATLSPTSLSFGTVTQGTASAGQTTTLTNNSGSTITFTGATFTGTNGSDFTTSSNTCSGALTTGNTCAITVVFTPTATPVANESGTLNVAYSGASGSPVTAALTGTSGGHATLSPTSLSFGTVAQGTSSSGLTTTLTNNSGSTITFTGTTFIGTNGSDFAASSNTCSGALTTGNTCAITVVFTPTATPVASESGTLNVAYTGASGSPVTAALTGTSGGIATLSPASLSFGTVTQGTSSPGSTTTLTNNSGSTITFTSATFTGANAGDFTASANTCTGTLAMGSTCAITVVFTPTATPVTNESGTLSVAYTGASGSPATALLTGTSAGAPAPATSLTITSVQ